MKNLLSLLLIVGLLVAGWMNREKLSGLWGKAAPVAEEEPEPVVEVTPPVAIPTPHPALEGQAEAKRIYPGLAVPNSALNQKFVALYADAQRTNPMMLTRPDWPLMLADRAFIELGGKPLPRGTAPVPRPSGQLPGSSLDRAHK